MPGTLIPMNIDALKNITAPSFDIPTTAADFVEQLPARANSMTGGFYGLLTLLFLYVYLIWKLGQEQYQGGTFGYTNNRSAGIAAGICGIVGLFAVNFGYFVNFFHIAIFIIIEVICVLLVWKAEL